MQLVITIQPIMMIIIVITIIIKVRHPDRRGRAVPLVRGRPGEVPGRSYTTITITITNIYRSIITVIRT